MNRPTCYHCDEKPARTGSVFCQECAPQPTAQECAEAMHGYPMPEIIHEPTEHPRPPEGFLAFLARLFAPYRHASNLAARFEALYRELQDTAQSNLALRRKCADLKAQRDALQSQLDSEEIGIKGPRGQLSELQARLDIQIALGEELATRKEEWKARAESAEAQLSDLRAQYQEGATE